MPNMTTITHLLLWEGIGGALLKVSGLLLLALGLMSLHGRAEPRWRVGIARTALVVLPLLLAAHFWAPKWEITVPAPTPPAPSPALVHPILAETTSLQQPPVASSDSKPFNWPLILTGIWALGSALAVFRETWRLKRLQNSVRSGNSPSAQLTNLWNQICREFNVLDVDLKIVSQNGSPFVAPGLQRCIAIPRALESQITSNLDATAHALRHEAAHLKSNDGIWIPLIRLAACALWFHPLVWWLAAAHLRACEEACDAAAARKGGVESYRKALAQMALDLVPVSEPAAATFLRAPSVLKRLRRVSENSRHRPPRWWAVLPVLTALSLLGGSIGIFQVIAEEPKPEASGIDATARKLKRIQIPQLEFVETPLRDALSFLARKSVEWDNTENEPEQQMLNFIVSSDLKDSTPKISLKLSNVSMEDALRYTFQLAGVAFEVEPHAILIKPLDGGNTPTPNPIDDESLRRKANSITIPSVDFRDTPFKDAISFLRMKSIELDNEEEDPAKKGLNIILKATEATDTRITLRLSNVPFSEALRYCAQLAQLRVRYEKAAILILPPADDKNLWTNVYDVPDWFLGDEHVKREELADSKIKTWLAKHGIDGPQGFSAVHNHANNWIIVRATEKGQEEIATRLQNLEKEREQFEMKQAVEAKLDRIIIPSVDFRDTPIQDAFSFLQKQSVQLDDQETDPAKKGINLIIRGLPEDRSPTVTLKLTNVPLSQALRYTAELAGMKMQILPFNAIAIVPGD